MEYPIIRDLDGVYFRVKREGKWNTLCFSDLTEEERARVSEGADVDWWRGMALCLASTLRHVGDKFNIFG